MSAQSHRSDPRVLGRRTLAQDNRRLAAMLRPGMSVLDAGCGTGSITAGIASAVGPGGRVVGLDRDESLIEIARAEHSGVSNLFFEAGDLLTLTGAPRFDIVTAARLLQWMSDPGEAVRRMAAAAKAGGHVVVLDYNHDLNSWTPEPPEELRRFYERFLTWRTDNGWDNRMGDHLPSHFEAAGLREISSYVEDEISRRGDPSADTWLRVIETIGPKFVDDADEISRATAAYRGFLETGLEEQRLSLRAVSAVR